MAITLKEESILNQWSMIVEHAANQGSAVLSDIERRLMEARLPEGCSNERETVQSSTWVAKVKREFLVCENDAFKDFRIYIGVRPYGKHLDVCRFVTVEPGSMKKLISERLTGDAHTLSGPKNILVEQDLRAWLTVVHHAVLDAIDGLFEGLKQDRSKIRRESRGILEIW